MPKVSEQVLLPHSADDLYQLVRDIRRYPEFIRWITRVKVSEETGDATSAYSCLGQASVHFKGFDEVFSTYVKGDPEARQIDVSLARGPFRRLKNRWVFDPKESGKTRVHCFIDYEFRNPILNLVARANTRLAIEKIMSAFSAEADRRFSDR